MSAIIEQLEFADDDMVIAKQVARRLGYSQFVYTSTSDMIGLFCLADYQAQRIGCVIKTKQFGFLFVADLDDLRMGDLAAKERELRCA